MSDFGLLIIWNDPYGMTLKGKSDKKMLYKNVCTAKKGTDFFNHSKGLGVW